MNQGGQDQTAVLKILCQRLFEKEPGFRLTFKGSIVLMMTFRQGVCTSFAVRCNIIYQLPVLLLVFQIFSPRVVGYL